MDACVSAGAGLAHRTAPALPGTGQRVHGALQGLVERSLRMLGPGDDHQLAVAGGGQQDLALLVHPAPGAVDVAQADAGLLHLGLQSMQHRADPLLDLLAPGLGLAAACGLDQNIHGLSSCGDEEASA